MKLSITIQDVCDFLNEMLALDYDMIHKMVVDKVECKRELVDHPTVIVSLRNGKSKVGLVGILNGMFGLRWDSRGPLSYYIKDGKIIRFEPTPENNSSVPYSLLK